MYFRKSNPFNYKLISDEISNRSISDFIGSDVTLNQPATNIVEKGERFLIELAAPGLSKEDFKIRLDHQNLIVSSEVEKEELGEDVKIKRKEFNYQSFKRTFLMPKEANKEEISAKYINGILTVTLLKKEEEKEKEAVDIEIK